MAYFSSDNSLIRSSLLIPLPVFVLACVTALSSLIGYMLHVSQKPSYILSLVSYLLLGATVSLLVLETGGIASPFIALWMLLAVFVGLFGTLGLALAFVAVNGYLA
jgi:hypothetical protein